MTDRHERYYPDLEAYHHRTRSGPCFICKIMTRDPAFPAHHIIYEDDAAIAFLNRYPTQCGYALVAPKEHKERVTGDFSTEEYLDLQRIVYRVSDIDGATGDLSVHLVAQGLLREGHKPFCL